MANKWMDLFEAFCAALTIDSKETGVGPLYLYGSQRRFLEEIAEGLERGIRSFLCLKARQQGISTVSLALDLFWLGVHPGLQGALITDNEGTRDDFRAKLARYLDSLPPRLRRGVLKHNRTHLILNNGSVLNYLVAGSRAKGNLGIGKGLNFVHATECSSWNDPEGLASLDAALAENYPDRLYIFESTARGFNQWWDMWKEAKDSPTKKRFFLPWFLKDDYCLKADDPLFQKYWDGTMSDVELDNLRRAQEEYNQDISSGQIAWYRKKRHEQGSDEYMSQFYPWFSEEAFIMSGLPFFPSGAMTKAFRVADKAQFKAYRYHVGEEFLATTVEQMYTAKGAELRVWEEPEPDAHYIIGADPAYGSSDYADRSCAEVWRCYSNKLVQVAEFASSNVSTAQFAWILAHLAGTYKNSMVNLEITGPGTAVFQELKHLRQLYNAGVLGQRAELLSKDIKEIFSAVRWFFYHRPDSMGGSFAYHWKTTFENKRRIMNELKDSFTIGTLMVNSLPLLEEMKSVTNINGSIGAEGRGKDDRVMASALAHVGWTDWIRRNLISIGESYEKVQERKNKPLEPSNPAPLVSYAVQDFFKRKEMARLHPDGY